jgi:hypothetical protein
MATIVTGYFELNKSKASPEKYKIWMQNMLMNNNPMVIFCDDKSYNTINELRNGNENNTRIIITKFEDFYSYRYSKSFFQHTQLDHEINRGHNMFLYMVWSEKSNFLKRAIELNPFHSEYFLWVDIGCFRVPNTEYLNWPNPKRIEEIPKDKILLLSVVPFTPQELYTFHLENLPSFQHINRIGAPIFGGGKEILLEWHKKYYSMLEYFIRINRFIGKDQSIMNSVFLMNREICELVQWEQPCNDIWFYLQEYLN